MLTLLQCNDEWYPQMKDSAQSPWHRQIQNKAVLEKGTMGGSVRTMFQGLGCPKAGGEGTVGTWGNTGDSVWLQ